MILTSISGIIVYQNTQNDNPIRYYVTKDNFYNETGSALNAQSDYMIAKNGKAVIDSQNSNIYPKALKVTNVTYNSLTYTFKSNSNHKTDLPFMLYNGVPYRVHVNGKSTKDFNSNQRLKIMAKKGNNTVTISSYATALNKVTFIISIISLLLAVGIYIKSIVVNRKSPIKINA
ncbi:hypothetical protein [Lactobacillus taiwanensis]|uniref:Uncharacterized protein n=2 Tax=Lactobacillus taiwanensis TaxID=508451 RepID=A0A256LF33_9LACO|nr:hypothetical protein [Lactobacillus taiwanensis]OYR87514.1 hypothetical protein CBF53_08745 [Lactobacillus taiwanensis]OYR91132.1 hypothetical protein CBF70_08180 [Lactobacillus taiwanensis]OYR91769.1 hypothetical protein CBF59_05200 [Lactobacillus taiwanensis]OYR94541.1 hypothetical protein CBF58_08955 [Lactobacillus taiwanensis]